jgi:hypothetical protein
MTTPLQHHYEFEEAVYEAFPRHPVPSLDDWEPQTWFERRAKPLFTGRTWPEIIGLRMGRDELGDSLVSWTGFIPSQILAYYLPSHLIFGSLMLWYGADENYVGDLVEGFMLPPPGLGASPDAGEDIDTELGLCAGVTEYAEWRLRLHRHLTTAQQAVVGQFLDLHLNRARQTSRYSERGFKLLAQNRDYWLDPSWQAS